MLRKLFPILGLSLIAFPATVLGLGLGEIRSASSLNEPFKGEIALIGVKTTELDTVKVQLASDKEFAKTGAQRFHFLSQLKFQPEASPSGHPVIAITSSQPIREPFLDFLVEVNWPQGRLVKEYTVLLDPPVTLPGVAPPPRVPAMVSPRTERLSPPAPARTAPRGQRSAAAPQAAAPATYGPVRRGETLWSIAKRVEVPGATHQQVMQSLFKENPEAFIGNDMNKLRSGATLTLGGQAASVRDVQPGPGGAEQTAATAGAEEKYRLRIASPKSGESAKGGAGAAPAAPRGDLEPDLSLVREESASIRQETGDLRQRVQDLESQLTDVRKLLKLRNAQLAQLQVAVMGADAGASAEAAKAPSVATQPPSEAEKEQTSPVALAGDGIAAVETPTAHRASGVPDTALTSEAAPGRPAGADSATDSTTPSTVQSTSEAAPSASSPRPRIEPGSGKSWMDTAAQLGAAMGEPTSLAVLGSTVAVLLLLLTYSVSRRHRAEASVPLGEPVPQAAGAPGLWKSVPEPGVMAAPRESADKWANVFGKQPQPQVEQPRDEDKDVLAEADVYLGFARYKDAATLVRDALVRQPERLDLKMKLAEIHHSAGDRAAFSRVFAEIKSSEQEQLDARSLERLSIRAADLGVDMDTGETKPAAQEPIPEPSPLMAEKAASMEAPPDWGARQEDVAEPLDLESSLDLDSALREIEEISSRPIAEVKDAPPRSAEEREVLEWLDKLGPDLRPTNDDKLAAASPEQSGTREAKGTKGPGPRESEASDDTAIKLDLARAYLAMSDNDGARFILEEVMEEAEGAQKAEAERLLASLE